MRLSELSQAVAFTFTVHVESWLSGPSGRCLNALIVAIPVARNAAMQTSNLKTKKRSKRKPSDLTSEEVSNVVSLLKNLVADLDEEDEDGQIVIENVQNVIRKLSQDTVCLFFSIVVYGHWWLFRKHLSFSDFTINALANAQVKVRLLKWKATGEEDATELGNKVSGAITMEETKKSLRNINNIVSMQVSYADTLIYWLFLTLYLQTEAGCRMVIDALLLHTALNLGSSDYGVAIIPEFRVDDTRLEPTQYTYGGVVDYMIIYTDRLTRGMSSTCPSLFSTLQQFPDAIARSPKFALLSDEVRKLLSCSIYEAKAKSDAVMLALPQAAMAAAVKAKNLGYVEFVLLNISIYLVTGSTLSEAALRLVGNGSFLYSTALMSGAHSPIWNPSN